MYGKMPGRLDGTRTEHHPIAKDALGGAATRKQITIYFTASPGGPKMDLLVYQPNWRSPPYPLFLVLISAEIIPSIPIRVSFCLMPGFRMVSRVLLNHRATEATRGFGIGGWPVEHILQRGLCDCHCLLWRFGSRLPRWFQRWCTPAVPERGPDA